MGVEQKNNKEVTRLRFRLEEVLEERISIIHAFGDCLTYALHDPDFGNYTDNNNLLSYGIRKILYLCTKHLQEGIMDVMKEHEKGYQ